MGKAKARPSIFNEHGKGFASIPAHLLQSEAFKQLKTVAGLKALPVFIAAWGQSFAKGGRPVCELSYSQAAKMYGIPGKSFSRGLQELHAHGFFDFEAHGGVFVSNAWTSSIYRQSERWRKFGTSDFKAVVWTPSEPSVKASNPKRRGEVGCL